jgi:biopolymer transport protein ExbD/biopolymer transport protein TolR
MAVRTQWRPRKASVVEPDINVTPLVDVVLVLLIIFMVVAPRMEQDIPVNLPAIFNPDPDAEVQSPPIMVTVKDAGEYHIDGQKYDLESAVGMLAVEHAADPYRRLDLRADAKLKYKDVREMYARLQQIGFPGLSLLVSDLSHHQKGSPPTTSAPAVEAFAPESQAPAEPPRPVAPAEGAPAEAAPAAPAPVSMP